MATTCRICPRCFREIENDGPPHTCYETPMENNIVRIRSGVPLNEAPKVNDRVVTLLQNLLDHAKSGRLQGAIVVGVNVDNSIASGWEGADFAAFTLLGGLEEVKHEYLLKQFERRP